ncbi:unnamed protein product [Psylliodes chrysocephalus]|uniref:Major facilitator superfamily (MFS) profile domain-containing protein n=1 Tax=Psylliodes chrysocephalus TaxID=3402493 RepID=A0A9P0D0L9_9CUCU|nr:unnamed protein product [Psylliodes chrysocephala]
MVHHPDIFRPEGTLATNEIKNNNIEAIKKKPDTVFLYFTVVTAVLLMITGGTTLVWQSPAIIKFKSNDTDVNPLGKPIETIEISILAGVPMMMSLIGGLVLPKLGDLIGRKKALQCLGLAMLLCLTGTAFSNRFYLFVILISCSCIIYNGIWGLLPIYLIEISEDHNRAKFGCLLAVCMPLGQLYCYVVGSVFSIRYFTLLNALPLIPFLLLFLFAPESPVYSLLIGKQDECMETLKKLRSNKSKTEIQDDFDKIKIALEEQSKNTNFSLITIFNTKAGRLGYFLGALPMIVQFFSGVPTVMSLMAPTFNEIGIISGNTIAIVVGAVKVFIYLFTSLVIERTGRRPLLLISSIGAGLAVSLVGIYFYVKEINSTALDQLQFLPVLAIIAYVVLYSIGLGPIPVAVMSEMFPADLRPIGNGCITTSGGIILSVVTFSFPLLVEHIGTHWCMFIFALNCFLGALVIYFIMPETKGKSVVEIQKILKEF